MINIPDEEQEIKEIKQKEKPKWTQKISIRMWVILAVGAIVFFNYIRQSGSDLQSYLPQIIIGGFLIYLIGSTKAEIDVNNSEEDAVKLSKALIDTKIKSGILPPGTKYSGGLFCDLKIHDGQPKHYVVSGKLIKPDTEVVNIGVKVDYKKPGNPRMYKSFGELRGDEQVPTVYLPGHLSKQRQKFPWLFGRGGGS